ncbi:noggin-like [Physella acuta]|uniref:noggin-like n=1 Tax=Physella acuta TaxID=109671 RepID=UPI0027DCBA1D|nr:noggin-like [Physella acuta]
MAMLPTLCFLLVSLGVVCCTRSKSEQLFRLLKPEDTYVETSLDSGRSFDPQPVGTLEENRNHPSSIDASQLLAQLGRNFDKRYMSITDPTSTAANPGVISFVDGRPKGPRPTFLKLFRSARLQDDTKIHLNLGNSARSKVQNYMWSLTYCPVVHTWVNLGASFWPQWIKKTSCTTKRSCSVPAGMTCQPSTNTWKFILRWSCQDHVNSTGCKWIPHPYKVITACSCKC